MLPDLELTVPSGVRPFRYLSGCKKLETIWDSHPKMNVTGKNPISTIKYETKDIHTQSNGTAAP